MVDCLRSTLYHSRIECYSKEALYRDALLLPGTETENSAVLTKAGLLLPPIHRSCRSDLYSQIPVRSGTKLQKQKDTDTSFSLVLYIVANGMERTRDDTVSTCTYILSITQSFHNQGFVTIRQSIVSGLFYERKTFERPASKLYAARMKPDWTDTIETTAA